MTVHDYTVRSAGEERSQWNSFFLLGAVGKAEVDVDQHCGPGQGAATMGIGHNFFTVLVTIVSIGIYSPNMAYVTCGEPSSKATAHR